MENKKLKVTIQITKNGNQGYICSCDYPFGYFDLGGSGNTIEEAKKDCFVFYNQMKGIYPKDNLPELEVNWVNKPNHTYRVLTQKEIEENRSSAYIFIL